MKQYFEAQIAGGATDQFFYGTENGGEVRIERHRGSLDSLPTYLQFTKMVGSTPFFTIADYDEAGGQQGWSET
jgi:hypothetical protein